MCPMRRRRIILSGEGKGKRGVCGALLRLGKEIRIQGKAKRKEQYAPTKKGSASWLAYAQKG